MIFIFDLQIDILDPLCDTTLFLQRRPIAYSYSMMTSRKRKRDKQEPTSPQPRPHKILKSTWTCAICMDTYCEPALLVCGHTFCMPCLERLPLDRLQCPLCRTPITTMPVDNRALADVLRAINKMRATPPANERRLFVPDLPRHETSFAVTDIYGAHAASCMLELTPLGRQHVIDRFRAASTAFRATIIDSHARFFDFERVMMNDGERLRTKTQWRRALAQYKSTAQTAADRLVAEERFLLNVPTYSIVRFVPLHIRAHGTKLAAGVATMIRAAVRRVHKQLRRQLRPTLFILSAHIDYGGCDVYFEDGRVKTFSHRLMCCNEQLIAE